MKNTKKLLLASMAFSLLSGCAVENGIAEPDANGKITFTEQYDLDLSSYEELPAAKKTKNGEDNLITYFTTYGVQFQDEPQYMFYQEIITQGRIFKVTYTYDSSKANNKYLLACRWILDDEDSLPDAYYYFSTYLDYRGFTSLELSGAYCYDYEDEEGEYYTEETVTFSDVEYSTCPTFTSVKYKIADAGDIPNQAAKKDDMVGAASFECIRVACAFADGIGKKADSTSSLW